MTKSQTEARITEIVRGIDRRAVVEQADGYGMYVRTSSGAGAMLAQAALIVAGFRVSGESEIEFYV